MMNNCSLPLAPNSAFCSSITYANHEKGEIS